MTVDSSDLDWRLAPGFNPCLESLTGVGYYPNECAATADRSHGRFRSHGHDHHPLLRIGPADNGRVMSLEEFREAEVEEGYRYELARGVLEVSEVPNDPHGKIVWNILLLHRGLCTTNIPALFIELVVAPSSAYGSQF